MTRVDDAKPLSGYEREPRARSLEARVIDSGENEGRAFLVLDDTILYPEGGGQPSDRGRAGSLDVTLVRREGGEIRHYLVESSSASQARPAIGESVMVELDWQRRFDHMQQHTAQHLLSAIAQDRFGWATTAFHLGELRSDIELDVAAIDSRQAAELEDAVAAEIRAARVIRSYRVQPEELENLDVRSRGLPAGHEGTVRLVEIDGIDLNTCGGTHLQSTAEIEAVALLGTEPMRGGTRLYFVAGQRLRERLREHEGRLSELRDLLDVGDDEIVDATRSRATRLADAARARKHWLERWCEAIGERLAQGGAPVVQLHDDACDLKALQLMARQLDATQFALLTGGSAPEACFLVRGAEGTDVGSLGSEVADLLEGRGGGRGEI